jgi:hypothetical protein
MLPSCQLPALLNLGAGFFNLIGPLTLFSFSTGCFLADATLMVVASSSAMAQCRVLAVWRAT